MTSTGAWWVLGVLALSACSSIQPPREQVPMDVADVMYDEPVETLRDLRSTSDAVVLAQPLPGDEVVLLDVDGIQVLGRRFRIVRVLSGPLEAGGNILVARPRYGVSPDTQQRLQAQGLEATAPPDAMTDNPPFDRPLYLLGLDHTGADYPSPAWTPANGPHSRIAFDADDVAAATAVVEVTGTPLQERLSGMTADQLMRRFQRR